ncbi:glycoside hydrolase family 16 protein [Hygrophoropsis aurantiaca]|uniref:Glycoside hydrolase family 16 protein n=1 Tax=Hygrophoropsis aurantiaca TaxID=72124 RepID=A0ACB8ALT1_9AGAM|nr:glycoside hydrolase family 16 protein [Hygrophoropsis aurantiaca]
MPFFAPFLILFSASSFVLATSYLQRTEIVGQNFYDAFHFEDQPDPTHGRVTYVNESIARESNLTFASSDTFIMRADYTTYLQPSDPGRNSVRIVSNQQYSILAAIFDMRHMPEGCGTWPAIWTVGADWPNQGEIDIVEGVNSMMPNTASVHTSSNCQMPSSGRNMSGISNGDNCAAYETNNAGCGVGFTDTQQDPRSFGPGFNSHSGGWYAFERTSSEFKLWFWSRSDRSVPDQVQYATEAVDTSTWGQPIGHWIDDLCDFTTHFGPHNIVINLALCGDWAGNDYVYKASGCPGTCEDFVNTNPATFSAAYFDFALISIYT